MAGLIVLVVVVVLAVAAVTGMSSARIIKQYERGVILRLGRLYGAARDPGFTLIVPFVDRLHKVNMQIVTMPIPAQEGITRDNVTVRVDAVVYFKVVDPTSAVVKVEDYQFAVSQMAQTSLRSIIGKSDLDDLLSNREKLNEGLELMIDSPAVGWGVQIDRVEIKDVSLPDTMKRSMARQAEANRERRARVINADAELQASKRLTQAAQQMSEQPSALQLRLLQTITAVAAEKNSTLVLPFPVELLRFLERAQQPDGAAAATEGGTSAPAPDNEAVADLARTPDTEALADLARTPDTEAVSDMAETDDAAQAPDRPKADALAQDAGTEAEEQALTAGEQPLPGEEPDADSAARLRAAASPLSPGGLPPDPVTGTREPETPAVGERLPSVTPEPEPSGTAREEPEPHGGRRIRRRATHHAGHGGGHRGG